MRLGRRSSLRTVVARVAEALAHHGIDAVLTGGACASLHSEGAYHSSDLDWIVTGLATVARMDEAMRSLGFSRRGNRYTNPRTRFFVEFPRGPLAIGGDHRIAPVVRRVDGIPVRMLSATDSCRDRLAAFYHWNDRQSLAVAVWIARRNRVAMGTLRRWSAAEGSAASLAVFEAELRRASTSRARRPARARRRVRA